MSPDKRDEPGRTTELAADERIFTCPMPLRWSDQDLNAHVNNARVVTLFEEARLQASAVWLSAAHPGPRLVRSLTVDYLRPLHYGEETIALVWIARLGRTSFAIHHELHQHGRSCSVGRTVMVHVDKSTGHPVEIDQSTRAALTAALIPEPAADARG